VTTPRFLLDTNILSEATRVQPNSAVLRKLKQYSQSLATASVVLHELMFGCYRLQASKRRQALEEYITSLLARSIPIFSYDLNAARWHALERARLVSLGRTPTYADGQIAAIAAMNNLILVTNNTVDYIDFQDVQLENWFEL
jgi:tRNA(fMet)-specific endonuclease VapC